MEQRKGDGMVRSDRLGARVPLDLLRFFSFILNEMRSQWRNFSRGVI